jgi:hypothetical protein
MRAVLLTTRVASGGRPGLKERGPVAAAAAPVAANDKRRIANGGAAPHDSTRAPLQVWKSVVQSQSRTLRAILRPRPAQHTNLHTNLP